MTHSKTQPTYKMNYNGWCNPWSGYGKANLNWATALERQTNGGISLQWERRTKNDDPDVWKDFSPEERRVISKPFVQEKIGVIQSTPDRFQNITNDIRIGLTMVENTKVGPEWIRQCNEMDALFVPNKQLIPIFQESGLKVPVMAIREGFNPDHFQYIERKPRGVFTFLVLGWLDDRKNWDDPIRAFTSEFAPNEPVRMIMKNTCPYFGYRVPNDSRIKYMDHIISPEELIKLYGMVDCLLFVTRGEGSGLPTREAMATGLPTILTNWLGTAEVCDKRYNYPIDPVAIDYPDNRAEQPGFMARLDVAEIMYWMRHVYEHRDEAMAKGKAASEWMHSNWTWDHCAVEMLDILKEKYA